MKTSVDLSNMERSCFLAKISHEIRTPLNGIIGMTEIAKRNSCTPEELTEYLKKIDISAQYLLALVNDIFDMAELEGREMKLETNSFSISELLESVEVLVQQQLQKKELNFVTEYEFCDRVLLGDRLKVQQIVVHLLENAARFTNQNGTVTLKVIEKENKEDCEVYFEVKNTGSSIRKEHVDYLFDLFEKQEDYMVRKYGGASLGLTIAKKLIALMGGTLTVSSTDDEESTFSFSLHFPKEKEARLKEHDSKRNRMPDFHGYKVLVVEDNSINMEITQTILEMVGFEVDCACNGKEALELYEKSKLHDYAGIIMDIQMPVMDGLEATRRIRSLERKDGQSVPIIAVSANAYDEDMKEALACGVDEYVAKPIDINKLYAVLEKRLVKES